MVQRGTYVNRWLTSGASMGSMAGIQDLMDLKNWSYGSLLGLVDDLRDRLAKEDQADMRKMRQRKLDEAIAEVRRRNDLVVVP